ncbi:MAG: 1-deoxy-D-xylulose-5-phosphate synthase [Chloroflexi bacterium]|nr:1-deoxy-D-xylulose-5-phosphate synthase [Chloroflexota bacterium]
MTKILDRVNEPADLRKLSYKELDLLAKEVRETIIGVITKRGGHLASNLGVVELTIALHRVFDSPNDKIVWDTTNQCYTHKMVTGRKDKFDSIRLEEGLSGFGEPMESPHDVLCAGHAGTGISIALGIAQAEQVAGSGRWTVGVVGDGAMTSGLSYEALNNIVHLKTKNLITILNDNGMSISDNIGFLTQWRQRMLSHPEYQAMVKRARRLTKKVPHGEIAYKVASKIKDGLEGIALPTQFWRELGFDYIGPVDGHDIAGIERALKQARNATRPPLIHLITHKGHGYEPAELDPVKFHQPSSPLGDASGAPTYSKVFAQTLIRLMERDPKIVGISAAMLEGTGLIEAQKLFPGRIYDVGIAEQHAVSMAAGMAQAGSHPFVSIYSTFMQRAYDQIVHDVCLQNLPVVLIADRAGIVGEDGKTHHGSLDISYLRSLPNMVVAAPRDENELQHMVYTGYKHNAPFAIRIARGAGVGVAMDKDLRELPIGKGEVLRQGDDITIIALGKSVNLSLEAAESLAKDGISALVVDARYAKPLDKDLVLQTAKATGKVLTVEENVTAGGFGSAVLETLSDAGVNGIEVYRLGMPDAFVEHATGAARRRRLGLDAQGIATKVREVFFKQRARRAVAENGRKHAKAGA